MEECIQHGSTQLLLCKKREQEASKRRGNEHRGRRGRARREGSGKRGRARRRMATVAAMGLANVVLARSLAKKEFLVKLM